MLFRENPNQFDLVISDMTMPVLNGLNLVRRLRQIRPDLPVILCSGYRKQLSAVEAKEIGINAFWGKPFTRFDLAVTVRRVLDERDKG